MRKPPLPLYEEKNVYEVNRAVNQRFLKTQKDKKNYNMGC